MTPEQQRELAIDCGACVSYHPFVKDSNLISFASLEIDELAAYTAAVEAPLQARIAQLEEALQDLLDEGVLKSSIICKALNKPAGSGYEQS